MKREDIIRMAREARIRIGGHPMSPWSVYPSDLEHFAALVAANVRETEFKPDWNNYRQGLADGAAAEREACAQIVDANAERCGTAVRLILESNAAAIRARGEQK